MTLKDDPGVSAAGTPRGSRAGDDRVAVGCGPRNGQHLPWQAQDGYQRFYVRGLEGTIGERAEKIGWRLAPLVARE
jgi:hypothetical protein